MKSDILETLYNNKTNFDTETPPDGHEKRFLAKLENQKIKQNSKPKLRQLWLPITAVAASILLLINLSINTNATTKGLASVSPEMAKTESYFTNTIAAELKKLKSASNSETRLIIKDALIQLNRLETEYKLLVTDLNKSGQDQRIIYAMISNFQNRIEILQNTLQQIEIVKQLKNSKHESNHNI